MKKVFLKLIRSRCVRRGIETAKIAKYFEMNGYEQTSNPAEADYIVIITCGFLEDLQERSLVHISELKKEKGELIVLGCLPAIVPEKLSRIFKGKVLPTRRLGEIDKLFPEFKTKYSEVPEQNIPLLANTDEEIKSRNLEKVLNRVSQDKVSQKPQIRPEEDEKAGIIKISTGCLEACSYCLIRKATGILRSKPLQDCVKEYQSLLARGFSRIHFIGEETGSYGRDIGTTLPNLLEKVAKIDKEKKSEWAITDMNPRWAIHYKDTLLKFAREKSIRVIGLAFQSGNPRILEKMRRNFNIKELEALILKLKIENPEMIILTQFIVGFPGETEPEFLDSLNLAKRLNVNIIQFFKYNDIKGSDSFNLPDKVNEEEKKRRMHLVKKEFCTWHAEVNLNDILFWK